MDAFEANCDAVILVTRGDSMPKKNYGTKLHPTYETSIRLKSANQKLTMPHMVVKFFDDYRDLRDVLAALKIGEGRDLAIDAPFPKTFISSALGIKLTEDNLQERCYLLNKWMQALFINFASYPAEAQKAISNFLSLDDDDKEAEANKNMIVSLLSRGSQALSEVDRQQSFKPQHPTTTTTTTTITTTKTTTSATTTGSKAAPAAEGSSSGSQKATPQGGRVAFHNEANRESLSDHGSDSDDIRGAAMTAANLNHHNEAASRPPAAIPRRGASVDSAVTRFYTGAEMEEYAKESIVSPFLAVSVLRGDMIPKSEGESRLHHSYETILRVLSLEECLHPDKANFDPEGYARYSALSPLTFSKVFDGYRQLKDDLEKDGVFSKDNVHKARKYNESEKVRRHAIVINSNFPRTLRRSSLGLGLSELQLQMRVVDLNHWVGELLKVFCTLPSGSQSCILEFFSLQQSNDVVAHNDETLSTDGKEGIDVVLSMLRCSFVPPPILVKVSEANRVSGPGLFKFLKRDAEKVSDVKVETVVVAPSSPPVESLAPAEPTHSTPAVRDACATELHRGPTSNGSRPAPFHGDDNMERLSDRSETTTMSKILTAAQVAEYSKEAVVHSFLAVKVVAGHKVAKKPQEQAKHPGFKTVVRLVSFSELQHPNKDRIDSVVLSKLFCVDDVPHSVCITRAFDGYRELETSLEKHGVFCHDAKGASTGAVVLEASFPRTHRRSSFGLGLTETQLRNRTALLNRFLGAVLTKYYQFTPAAQEIVNNFLHVDEDNPAEPHSRVIISILKKSFSPPLIALPPNQLEKGSRNLKPASTARHNGKFFSSDPYSYDEQQQELSLGYGKGVDASSGSCCVVGMCSIM